MLPIVKIGPYEVTGTLGRGGVGAVFRARSPAGEAVAVKVLLAADAARIARFERERRLLAKLTEKDGFVPLLDAGTTQQGPFIVMPIVPGGTLRDRLERGPLGIDETLALGRALALAMGRAHALGIVHRDLKPENVLFTAEGAPLVADLGLGKHFDPMAPGASQSIALSKAGTARGTFGYMPVEQMRDAASVGPPADVFAIGAILHECLAGAPAFDGDSFARILDGVASGKVASLAALRPETPRFLAAAVERALSPEAKDRFASGKELLLALAAPPRRARLALALAGVLLVAALAFVAAWRPRAPLAVTIEAPAPGLETPEDEVLLRARASGGAVTAEVAVGGEPAAVTTLDAVGLVETTVRLPASEGDVVLLVRVRDAGGDAKEAGVTIKKRAWAKGERVRARRKAAEAGDVFAMLEVARSLWRGLDVTPSEREALVWYRRAAALGNRDAMFELGVTLERREEQDLGEAAQWYRKGVTAGEARAMDRLAVLLASGRGVAQNDGLALGLFRQAASTGDAGAKSLGSAMGALHLGYMLKAGWGVAKDEREAARQFAAAFRLLSVAADSGDVAAAGQIRRMYSERLALPTASVKTLRKRAAAGTSSTAYVELGWKIIWSGDSTRWEEATASFEKAAAAGNTVGMAFFGMMLKQGQGIAAHEAAGRELVRDAALAGDPGAMMDVYQDLPFAHPGSYDEEIVEAAVWCRRAAEAGYPHAMRELALILFQGRGVPKDEAESALWYRRAAAELDEQGMYSLGLLLLKGEGEPVNETEAAFWFRRSADCGNSYGMMMVGDLLAAGKGVAKDEAEALRFYKMSAEDRNDEAALKIGLLLEQNPALAKNASEAAGWYRNAALMANEKAMVRLASLLEQGKGVTQDRDEAIMWYQKAAERGNGEAKRALRRLGAE